MRVYIYKFYLYYTAQFSWCQTRTNHRLLSSETNMFSFHMYILLYISNHPLTLKVNRFHCMLSERINIICWVIASHIFCNQPFLFFLSFIYNLKASFEIVRDLAEMGLSFVIIDGCIQWMKRIYTWYILKYQLNLDSNKSF